MEGTADRPSEGDRRTVAGRYTLLARLGVGGMGTVWRAHDDVLGREVAVKEIVFPHGLPDAEREVLRERTRREARAAARLDHPSAVTVYDVVEQDGQPFLVMELVQARTLAEVVRTDGPLTPRQAARTGLAVLGALEAAHARGIVHRDVKPGNVLLTAGADDGPGRVVLTDFGIATSSGDASITSTGLILGSPSYIAPERCRGQAPGPASDLWSLGATLFTAVEGRPAYDAGDPLATVTAVVTGDHAPFRAAGPLQPVIEGLLAREPADRLDAPTARRMLAEVAEGTAVRTRAAVPVTAGAQARADRTTALPVRDVEHAAEAPAPASLPRPLPPRPSRPGRPVAERRRRAVALPLALAAVLVTGGLVGGLALLTGGDDAPSPQASASPSPSPSAPASPTPDPTESPDGEVERPAGVPADWEQYTDDQEGWTLFHPARYAVSDRGQLKQFRDEERRFTLRVDHTTEPPGTALEAARTAAAGFRQALPGYQELRLEEVAYRGYDAAEVEFTWTDPEADLRVLNRTFVVDGRAYSLYWQVAVERFPESLEDFESLALAFVPAP